jgi:uncharacterized repeat protein (TIGR03806 family)
MDERRVGSLRRQVTRVTRVTVLCVVGVLSALAASCSSDDDATADEIESPCRAFARNQTELLTTEAARDPIPGTIARILSSSSRGAFALTMENALYPLDEPEASPISLEPLVGKEVVDIAVGNEDRFYALVRAADGSSLDVVLLRNLVSPQPVTQAVFSVKGNQATIAVDRAGGLLIGTPDVSPSEAQDPASRSGKLLRISDPERAPAVIDVVARGFRAPTFLSLDPDTDEIWLTDVITSAAGSLHYELNRVSTFGKSYGWPIIDGLRCADGSTNACVREGHVGPLVAELTDPRAVFFRGADWPLSGQLLTNGGGSIGTIAPFGPSGPPLVRPTAFPTDKQINHLGVGRRGVYLAVSESEVHLVTNGQPHPVPTALSVTGCNGDNGPPGAIAYDVASPLWSDGAEKKRFVVLPKGAQARVLDDGDIRFPVGTVAIKTFSVDGRKIETRLLIQHSLEFWVGYSYRWAPDGSDASLVIGNRTERLSSTKAWYFPSSAECAACHTPSAGYTLGLEARQIVGPANAALDKKLLAPIDHGKFPAFSSAASVDQKARAYLHANCSICHREGSVTGIAELDLRFDTPLDKTGLCNAPKVDSLGVADNARVVLPKKPGDSILVKRMRSTDPDIRMPKLATRIVDEAGTAVIEDWIRSLASCP